MGSRRGVAMVIPGYSESRVWIPIRPRRGGPESPVAGPGGAPGPRVATRSPSPSPLRGVPVQRVRARARSSSGSEPKQPSEAQVAGPYHPEMFPPGGWRSPPRRGLRPPGTNRPAVAVRSSTTERAAADRTEPTRRRWSGDVRRWSADSYRGRRDDDDQRDARGRHHADRDDDGRR